MHYSRNPRYSEHANNRMEISCWAQNLRNGFSGCTNGELIYQLLVLLDNSR
jgi:hypothetical protein